MRFRHFLYGKGRKGVLNRIIPSLEIAAGKKRQRLGRRVESNNHSLEIAAGKKRQRGRKGSVTGKTAAAAFLLPLAWYGDFRF
jgi:hypothetical protein